MQSWFRYSLAFFALVLVLTGFIYVLGPASTREAAQSGETQTGQILDPDHTLVSQGENPGNTGMSAPTEQGTESGTTTSKEGNKAQGAGTAATTASPSPTATPAAKDAHKGH